MDRRAFGRGAAALLLLATSRAAHPQPAGKVFRIGFLANHIPLRDLETGRSSIRFDSARALVDGLRQHGWEEGRNIQLVWRSAESRLERHPALAAELVGMRVDLIVTFSEGVDAAAAATKTIPIVMGGYYNPVEAGLVKSLAHPGGNVTGLVSSAGAEFQKTLSLIREALPRVSRVTILHYDKEGRSDPTPQWVRPDSSIGKASRALGLDVRLLMFGSAAAVGEAIAAAVRDGAQFVWVEPTYALYGQRETPRLIAEAAIRHRVPMMHNVLSAVDDGALMAHGTDDTLAWKRVPYYVDRILRGAKPGDLPIEQPARVEFHVNLRAAKAIALDIPASLLLQADRVIQ